MRRILCFFGFHSWHTRSNPFYDYCGYCPRIRWKPVLWALWESQEGELPRRYQQGSQEGERG